MWSFLWHLLPLTNVDLDSSFYSRTHPGKRAEGLYYGQIIQRSSNGLLRNTCCNNSSATHATPAPKPFCEGGVTGLSNGIVPRLCTWERDGRSSLCTCGKSWQNPTAAVGIASFVGGVDRNKVMLENPSRCEGSPIPSSHPHWEGRGTCTGEPMPALGIE